MYSTSQCKKSLYEKQNRWGFFRRFNLCVWLRCVVVVFFWCYQVGPGATTNTNTILLRCGSSHPSGCYKLTAHLLLQCVCVCVCVYVCGSVCVKREEGKIEKRQRKIQCIYHTLLLFLHFIPGAKKTYVENGFFFVEVFCLYADHVS